MNSSPENGAIRGLTAYVNTICRVVQQFGGSLDAACAAARELASFAGAGVLLCGLDGRVLAEKTLSGGPPAFPLKKDPGGALWVDKTLLAGLGSITEPVWNLPLSRFLARVAQADALLFAVIPVVSGMERFGALFVYIRKPAEFDDTRRSAVELTAVVAALGLNGHKSAQAAKSAGRAGQVKASLDTLSYSELTAAIEIFGTLSGTEGYVVASRIAGRSGVTRSAIVNALRKLESAGIVESRSLGVKGTYIKVLNEALLGELEKFK